MSSVRYQECIVQPCDSRYPKSLVELEGWQGKLEMDDLKSKAKGAVSYLILLSLQY